MAAPSPPGLGPHTFGCANLYIHTNTHVYIHRVAFLAPKQPQAQPQPQNNVHLTPTPTRALFPQKRGLREAHPRPSCVTLDWLATFLNVTSLLCKIEIPFLCLGSSRAGRTHSLLALLLSGPSVSRFHFRGLAWARRYGGCRMFPAGVSLPSCPEPAKLPRRHPASRPPRALGPTAPPASHALPLTCQAGVPPLCGSRSGRRAQGPHVPLSVIRISCLHFLFWWEDRGQCGLRG